MCLNFNTILKILYCEGKQEKGNCKYLSVGFVVRFGLGCKSSLSGNREFYIWP